MPIIASSTPSIIGANALQEAQAGHVARTVAAPLDLGGQPPAPSKASPPLPVYAISSASLIQSPDQALSTAEQSGWRVLTTGDGESQVVDVEKGSNRALTVRRGASADILARAGLIAEQAADPATNYEPRILDFGRLGLSALWLHSDVHADLFFTLEPQPKQTSDVELIAEAERRARMRASSADLGGATVNNVKAPDIGG